MVKGGITRDAFTQKVAATGTPKLFLMEDKPPGLALRNNFDAH